MQQGSTPSATASFKLPSVVATPFSYHEISSSFGPEAHTVCDTGLQVDCYLLVLVEENPNCHFHAGSLRRKDPTEFSLESRSGAHAEASFVDWMCQLAQTYFARAKADE